MPPVPEPRAVTPEPPAPPAVPADDNLNSVLWVQRSAEYAAITTSLFRAAAERLETALAEPNWDALVPDERGLPTPTAIPAGTPADTDAATRATTDAGSDAEADAEPDQEPDAGDDSDPTPPTARDLTGLPPAVILDIDETVLDNSPYQARMVLDGTEFNDLSWDQWVAEKKARAVPGVVDFAKAAEARGVTLLYISNRAVHLREATLANLRDEGLPVKDDSVFLGMGLTVEGCEQARESDKLCRRELAGRNYRVLMQFGDQLGDFVRIPDNSIQGRGAILDEYRDWFGERWWVLPNPTYGSWEPAVFGNDWAQPRDARRQAKRQALQPAR
ncbi:MAG: HAD family acid phosphatase [Pseudoxanthomonas suwonensis]|nr:HAD family acid phosphatase [Pseudoxanthomonas suwonensis]